ncbi:tripartite ATP-independent transporter DctM subunit [Leucobacter exalbidus]|uniref:Tripartite ATP-independent transporter DctM subunit n=1 Tax=Leucobacter exalbidus TaxID=662960 RepID=A0A940Q067_9MICO|nr:TRAP transporter large permease [Leucobacter exalbidus]MBP1327311.1 tripartite ATP-independent transporter DctM subunit [Leucobacter exalbidus]
MSAVTTLLSIGVEKEPREPGFIKGWLSFSINTIAVIASGGYMFLPSSDKIGIGIAGVVMMVALLFMKFPAAMAMILPSLLAMYAMRGWAIVETSLMNVPIDSISSWSLSVLPMFIVMGLLMWRSGMTEGVYKAARQWFSWMPGGLAVGTNLAGTGLATVSGSTAGVVYALSRIGIPEMLKAGYDKRLALGSVIVASLPGQLIPPSILLVLYAGIAEVPVGQQLLSGILPGVVVAIMFTVMLVIMASFFKMGGQKVAGKETAPTSWSERWRSLARTWPLPILAAIIIVGMFSGLFTATEAGAFAALCALILTFLWKPAGGGVSRPITAVRKASIGAVANVGGIFFMLVGVEMLSRMMTLTGIGNGMADLVAAWDLNRVEFLIVMTVVYLVLGAFMESLPMMVLTVPLLIPTLESLDISLLWFGVFVVFMGELAVLSPPVGMLAMIIHSIVKDPEVNQGQTIKLSDIFWTMLWFLPMAVLVVAVLIAWPDLATIIPTMSNAG